MLAGMSVPARLDFATYSPRGAPSLLVEAKRLPRSDPAWATEWRRNLFEYQPQELTDAILALVTLERIFVWPVGAASDAPPTFVFDTGSHLGKYFERVKESSESLTPQGFEYIVSWWLEDLSDPQRDAELSASHRIELERSGLLAALRGAAFVEGAAASW
jgi:hypothetical protein